MPRARVVETHGGRKHVLVFAPGEEVVTGIQDYARSAGIRSAAVAGLGAFAGVTLAYFDMERKEYLPIPIQEQVEVLALTGNLAQSEGSARLHAHVVIGLRDGTTRGGHLLQGEVRPTLEVVLDESFEFPERQRDPETGLALLS